MMTRRLLQGMGTLLALLLSVSPALADDGTQRPPRIGLVLSGGGALGSAHVGALKVLEELRIPVHYVAGTSMGAIVGGLYAAGVSPVEMEELLATTDWRDVLDDRPPRRQMPYRQKVDDQTYLTRLEAGFNRGSFRLPSGLISGHKVGFALQEMMLRAAEIDDFDLLPIPFRTVATDIETGERVVLEGGDLGRAVRASLSIPGIFSPVEIDGRLLVDGGFTGNLPVDVVRDMGAEIVIAVDVGQPLFSKDELSSLNRVMGQIVGVQIRTNVQLQAAQADVLIKPVLEGFSASQFERGLEMVPFGEEAARQVAEALSRYSVSAQEFAQRLKEVRREPVPRTKISSVELAMGSSADANLVLSRVTIRPGDAFDLQAIRRNLDRLYETGDFERVDFFLTHEEDGYGLHIEAHEKSWGPNYLRFGVSLFSDFEGESSFGLLNSVTLTRLNRSRGEIKVRAEVGENPGVSGEIYQPLSRAQTWFVALGMRDFRATSFSPVGEGLFAPYRISVLDAAFDLGLQLGQFGEMRLGLSRSRVVARLRGEGDGGPSAEVPREIETDLGGIRFSAILDQFDNMNFPRHGYFAVVQAFTSRKELGAESDYERVTSFLGVAASRGRHTVLGLGNFHDALGSESPEIENLGRLFALSGYRPEDVVGRYGGSVALLYLNRIFELPSALGNGVYLGASLEVGNLWDERDQVDLGDLLTSGSLTVGLDTVLGPVYFALAFNEEWQTSAYLLLGRTF